MNDERARGGPLPWHDGLWAYMATGLAERRVAHGLLFCGPPGVGKRVFAQEVMAALLCRARSDDARACGECPACRQRAAGTHPDISRLEPEESGKRIKVEQVRRFSHALHLTPQYDSGRIGWIDPAESLSASAANSLLKTLEEPPAGCHILLVTDRLSALLPTLRSRCQMWRVPAADPQTARTWLVEQGVSAADLPHADRLRTPLAARAGIEHGLDGLMAQWDQDLSRLLRRRANPVAIAERAAEADRRLWSDWLYRRCNDLMQVCVIDEASAGLDEATVAAARTLGIAPLQGWSHQVTEVVRRLDSNADWRLMLESLFIDLSQRIAGSGARR